MKYKWRILPVILMIMVGLIYIACGGAQDSTGGGGELEDESDDDDSSDDDDDGDDDDDAQEDNECLDTVNLVYNCGHYFIATDGNMQTTDQAYTECLARSATSDMWKCRINCAEGSLSCEMLYERLVLCPVDSTGATDDTK